MLLATTTETALWLAAVLVVPLFVLGIADARARRDRGGEVPTTVELPDAARRNDEAEEAREGQVVRPAAETGSGGEQGSPMGSGVPH
jgi:hypothetical protein